MRVTLEKILDILSGKYDIEQIWSTILIKKGYDHLVQAIKSKNNEN